MAAAKAVMFADPNTALLFFSEPFAGGDSVEVLSLDDAIRDSFGFGLPPDSEFTGLLDHFLAKLAQGGVLDTVRQISLGDRRGRLVEAANALRGAAARIRQRPVPLPVPGLRRRRGRQPAAGRRGYARLSRQAG